MAIASRIVRIVAGATAALLLLVAVVAVLPTRLVRPKGPITAAERLKAENDVRPTLVQMLAGAALLSGLYFSARTLRVNREGQITERFTRAIDQLGDDELAVRLEGIYASERIARNSKQDHAPIMRGPDAIGGTTAHHIRRSGTPELPEHFGWRLPRQLRSRS